MVFLDLLEMLNKKIAPLKSVTAHLDRDSSFHCVSFGMTAIAREKKQGLSPALKTVGNCHPEPACRTKVLSVGRQSEGSHLLVRLAICILIVLEFASCSSNTKPLDTPTTGEITISVDETFSPVADSEVSVFNSLYKYAKILPRYVSETQAFQDLINDSARLIIVSRNLKANEKKFFENIKITPRILKVAIDGLALIVNKENTDTAISYAKMKDVFGGRITQWKEVNSGSKLSDIQIIFDNKNSSTARYVKEIINNNDSLPKNCFAVNTNAEVIEYVSKNKNAMGIIGVNWISDGDDPVSKGFLNKIKVMAVAPPDTAKGSGNFYQPYQAYLAKEIYPLRKEIFIISREARSGLGTGFASFVASDKGQRIILKSGLLPATMPVRIIQLHQD